jgi:protein-tyrosine phosphatase
MIHVCFVCLGNICRSPTAEGIMIELVRIQGLDDSISIDSAGTESWHAGKGADSRSQATANNRGVQLPSRSRQFKEADFSKFDYVIAMDASNLSNLAAIAPGSVAPKNLSMLREYDLTNPGTFDVPDPYYGGSNGFETVYDLCETACQGLLEHIRREHGLT